MTWEEEDWVDEQETSHRGRTSSPTLLVGVDGGGDRAVRRNLFEELTYSPSKLRRMRYGPRVVTEPDMLAVLQLEHDVMSSLVGSLIEKRGHPHDLAKRELVSLLPDRPTN